MITQNDIQAILEKLPVTEQIRLLLTYGHQLTVMARDSYEFQGAGVVKPELLRGVNEINHRLFPNIESLIGTEAPAFPSNIMASWIAGEGRPTIAQGSLRAFERALVICDMRGI